eukprot:scaffold46222_cov40-Cyclotella_meneghiniana.AAC.1
MTGPSRTFIRPASSAMNSSPIQLGSRVTTRTSSGVTCCLASSSASFSSIGRTSNSLPSPPLLMSWMASLRQVGVLDGDVAMFRLEPAGRKGDGAGAVPAVEVDVAVSLAVPWRPAF